MKTHLNKNQKEQTSASNPKNQNSLVPQSLPYTDNRPEAIAQRKLKKIATNSNPIQQVSIPSSSGGVIQKRNYYAYGSAASSPHVHVYGVDSHLQISVRGRVRRLNIVKNGQLHAQRTEALEAAAGNQTLIDVIQGLIDAV